MSGWARGYYVADEDPLDEDEDEDGDLPDFFGVVEADEGD